MQPPQTSRHLPGVVAIDRRIRIVAGSGWERGSLHAVSELRSTPFVVFLGEPGIGKSTVLELEAMHEQCSVLTVRALMTGSARRADATLYLDALDEFRIDGHPIDKVHG